MHAHPPLDTRCPRRIVTGLAAVCACTLAIATAARAQVGLGRLPGSGGGGASAGPHFGVIIGTNLASISDADRGVTAVVGAAYDTKRRVGLNAGVYGTFHVVGALSLQPEAHYSQQGVTYQSTVSASAASAAFKIDYVQVPVLLRLDVAGSHALHPILLAGASGAFRISCTIDNTTGSASLSRACSENTTSTVTDPIKKYDVSAVGGAGLVLAGMGRSYALTIRYAQGLANLSTVSGSTANPRNSVFSIQLAIGN